ncbi:sugar ABC transporter substrate-binding protein [Xylanimonas oleitrophica]|uniref:Sugar ABC transporter substrate-binding protein n=1 Tax=Xylanimonas oleitrophica TaxID=2607479 RepID=A0A2W5XUW4_9MICO|nr:sugar-binding protein [Xylanimonas oleitrophica]PZR54148.1 sugar ABC transporter substrate-binding protein [Xylanimonas oleitrophica]
MRIRIVAAALAAGALSLTAGCSGPGSPGESGGSGGSGETPLVGVAMPTTTSDRWIDDAENLRNQFESLGFDVSVEFAEDDPATQVEQLAAMVEAGADALVVGSVDGKALTGVLADAHAAGIPVVSYDRLIRDSKDIDYYASFDNARVGVLQGTALLTGLGILDASGAPTGVTGPFNVELFAGSPDDNNATVFYDGAMSVLRPYLDAGVLVVPSGQTDFESIATQAWSADEAAARMATLVPAYGEGRTLDGVLSPYDGISRAVLTAAASIGQQPVVTGQDAEIDSVKLIAQGTQYATVYKDTRQLAEVTVQMVQALLAGSEPEVNDTTSYDNGAKVVPSYLLAPQAVTQANYTKVLVDSGYYTAEEIR